MLDLFYVRLYNSSNFRVSTSKVWITLDIYTRDPGSPGSLIYTKYLSLCTTTTTKLVKNIHRVFQRSSFRYGFNCLKPRNYINMSNHTRLRIQCFKRFWDSASVSCNCHSMTLRYRIKAISMNVL